MECRRKPLFQWFALQRSLTDRLTSINAIELIFTGSSFSTFLFRLLITLTSFLGASYKIKMFFISLDCIQFSLARFNNWHGIYQVKRNSPLSYKSITFILAYESIPRSLPCLQYPWFFFVSLSLVPRTLLESGQDHKSPKKNNRSKTYDLWNHFF